VRNLQVLLAVAATNNTAWNLVTPFVPLFLLEIVHGDAVAAATWSGLALGVSPLMTAVAGPFWTMFAQRYGARPAILRTLLMAPILVVLMAFSTAIWQIVVLRFLVGVLGGFYILVHALAAQTAPRDRIGQAIGSLQAIQMVALALVPPVAGLFTDLWGIRSNFLLAAGIMVASFLMMLRGYDAPAPTSADAAHGKKAGLSYWSLLKSRELALVAVVVFTSQYVERTFWPLAPLLVVDMEPGSEQVGLMTGLLLGIGSAATALSALISGRLARRYSTRTLLIASLVGGCVTLPILAAAGSVWQFIGLRIVMGLLTGGMLTLAYAHVSALLPPDDLSASFSMFASVAMVASAVGPFSLSPLASTLGLRSPLLVSAAAFGACLMLFVVSGRNLATRSAPRQEPSAPGGSA
jgi:DHA1 family multidrug resistance protein-like MFS transporter